ncbi:N-acetyltransferase [Fusibacter paucivorans]|uniref:N-acetyltransferase n=1 Tax=Fusibacter paucivorans TaxID=76009 RepID=A0ABS5PW52_9FIRM|nr:N-acetyltransferase [Fusibacter paucivorans]MBS7528497.1 N-acetyltransferase [Fusibacter paucivorans]
MIKSLTMTSDEIEAIMHIWYDATIKAHPFIPATYWRGNYEIVKNEYIPNSETFLYCDGSETKGFISIIERAFIGALFVDPAYQGQGIGMQLLSYVLNKYDNLSLAVYIQNENAVSFYQKMGFSVISEQLNSDSQVPEYLMSTRGASAGEKE